MSSISSEPFTYCHLNEAKNLIFTVGYKINILRIASQNNIAKQPNYLWFLWICNEHVYFEMRYSRCEQNKCFPLVLKINKQLNNFQHITVVSSFRTPDRGPLLRSLFSR